jgi:hypothetical protein
VRRWLRQPLRDPFRALERAWHRCGASRDKRESSDFLASLFGLSDLVAWGPFLATGIANQVTLDFLDADGEIAPQHDCFLVGEHEFDEIFGRVRAHGDHHEAARDSRG